jgi:hypothetical protein
VHESPDCIIDLVRNLKHLDPASEVLVYNGSSNPLLLESVPLAHHGAIAHPSPQPMRWGALHRFAIDCMRFARKEFDFEALTIVDSDQLSLRAGYSARLAQFLAGKPNAGLLGNSPARQIAATAAPPARVAFAEIDLWRPLLRRFKDGEDKFPYWSFWPATVYTAAAARDLTDLFDYDSLLRDIMGRSHIWATEEVILPTLAVLLGYEILAHPYSYDFVKYRVPYTRQQIQQALARPDVFWAHPIPRRPEDPLRKQIRQYHGEYGADMKTDLVAASATAAMLANLTLTEPPLLLTCPILGLMRRIEGWLEEDEADLLIAATARALSEAPQADAIVEVGSYCGRATVVLASVTRACRPRAKVHAIDPHSGRLGTIDKIVRVPPSLDKLRRNLASAGLTAAVEVIQAETKDVSWSESIALLLIDGLHDYSSVRADFRHFEPSLAAGGYVAFHDYADYFPGVVQFVQELLATPHYRFAGRSGSMIVLHKSPGESDQRQL